MSESNFYITEATVDDTNMITWNQELEQERKSAVFDLTNNCYFKLNHSNTGPYKIKLSLKNGNYF